MIALNRCVGLDHVTPLKSVCSADIKLFSNWVTLKNLVENIVNFFFFKACSSLKVLKKKSIFNLTL